MSVVLAIDPGSAQSAYLFYDDDGIQEFGILPNDILLLELRVLPDYKDLTVVIEKIESYGMAVGAEVFATVHWSGRFTEAVWPREVVQLPRREVKLELCGNPRAKDANIRQALIDRLGPQGTKKAPGPTYGISKDVWSALAIAVTYAARKGATDAL